MIWRPVHHNPGKQAVTTRVDARSRGGGEAHPILAVPAGVEVVFGITAHPIVPIVAVEGVVALISDQDVVVGAAVEVGTDKFKEALREHYDGLPEEIKQLGVLRFASYPPPGMDNAVTRLWDKHMRPDWREIAQGREA